MKITFNRTHKGLTTGISLAVATLGTSTVYKTLNLSAFDVDEMGGFDEAVKKLTAMYAEELETELKFREAGKKARPKGCGLFSREMPNI